MQNMSDRAATLPDPPPLPSPQLSGRERMDEAVARVAEAAPSFAALPLKERIALAGALAAGFARAAAGIVDAGCRAKGIRPRSSLEGEEWATGPVPILRMLRLLRHSLESLDRTGNTPAGVLRERADGRLAVRLFPMNALDGFLLRGVEVEGLLQGGMDEDAFHAGRAAFYRQRPHRGRSVLILGGGNLSCLAPLDVLTKLFVEGKTCVLKMNPVNAYLGPLIEEACAEAVEKGYLAVLYGGAEEGDYLCRHPGIDEIHLTGSDRTHDAIVWGADGTERKVRLERADPRLHKPITSELGNVSPVLVVPGPYSGRELRYQAEDLVGAATMNASFLCNSAKVTVTPAGWPGREQLLRHVEETLARLPSRTAYYPGAVERWHRFTAGRPRLRTFGHTGAGRLPWTIVDHLAASGDDPLFSEESFTPVLAEVGTGSADPLEFLEEAVNFANRRLWGTLCATLVVHPGLMADPVTAAAVERAILRLRYGTVAVNVFPGLAFALGSPPWGACPGSSLADIQSGRGWVHNAFMVEGVEKVILSHPLTTYPRPPYHPRHRSRRILMKRLALLEQDYSWGKVPSVTVAALQG